MSVPRNVRLTKQGRDGAVNPVDAVAAAKWQAFHAEIDGGRGLFDHLSTDPAERRVMMSYAIAIRQAQDEATQIQRAAERFAAFKPSTISAGLDEFFVGRAEAHARAQVQVATLRQVLRGLFLDAAREEVEESRRQELYARGGK